MTVYPSVPIILTYCVFYLDVTSFIMMKKIRMYSPADQHKECELHRASQGAIVKTKKILFWRHYT